MRWGGFDLNEFSGVLEGASARLLDFCRNSIQMFHKIQNKTAVFSGCVAFSLFLLKLEGSLTTYNKDPSLLIKATTPLSLSLSR